jgi:hypothetical protein
MSKGFSSEIVSWGKKVFGLGRWAGGDGGLREPRAFMILHGMQKISLAIAWYAH